MEGEKKEVEVEVEGEGEVEKEWEEARWFIARGPSATLQFLKEEPRSLLFAYELQATEGPCPPHLDLSQILDPSLRRKHEVWRSLGGLPRTLAKKSYVELLSSVLPQWKDWYSAQGRTLKAAHDESKGVDPTAKIIADFYRKAMASKL